MQTEGNTVRFTLGGMLFEYDPEKNRKILRNTEYLLRAPRAYSSTMIVLNSMMKPIVRTRTVTIQ